MRFNLVTLALCSIFVTSPQDDNSRYLDPWNSPTISLNGAYFGYASSNNRHPVLQLSELPAIPGLRYRTCFEMCPVDTCYASRAIFALRCPDEPALLQWASSRGEWLLKCCETGEYDVEVETSGKTFPSDRALLNHYTEEISRRFRKPCANTGPDPNRQIALLITDCWSTERFTTFYEASWYDHCGNGNTFREAYSSVDRATGEVATLDDLVEPSKQEKLSELMIEYLRDSNGDLWRSSPERRQISPIDVLHSMDGCALIREGLVIFYLPYTIASGVEGEIKAVIPYDVIRKL